MKLSRLLILLYISTALVSCKDYYNETIDWADNLENEQSFKDVQKEQPNYIDIDWKNPQIVDNQKWYLITKIKGNNDILGMSHYLVFIEDKFQYRESKK
ncbi:hypothetical protein [Formosa algae]|uniref:hypothetical protein n=1 Tax=Formosa algae TaxID=225843 RepID=UPI000CCF12F0|nr:hypothetical protein [Formosa algae]PNW25805.1 hypothetical protein BKP44_19080 [Formosa algae]